LKFDESTTWLSIPYCKASALLSTSRLLNAPLAILFFCFQVLPFFILRNNPLLAKRISAAIAITIMFFCGFSWGKYAGTNPWITGATVVVVGGIVEGVIIALGGWSEPYDSVLSTINTTCRILLLYLRSNRAAAPCPACVHAT
jgi:hypothetical protein